MNLMEYQHMQKAAQAAVDSTNHKQTAKFDHKTATTPWLIEQMEISNGLRPRPYRLQYEWTRKIARKRFLIFNSIKKNYRAEAERRKLYARAINKLPDLRASVSSLPQKLFRHTLLEQAMYGVVYAYQSFVSLLTLIFVLVFDKITSWLDRAGLTFEQAMDENDVRYLEWKEKNKDIKEKNKDINAIKAPSPYHAFYDHANTSSTFAIGDVDSISSLRSRLQTVTVSPKERIEFSETKNKIERYLEIERNAERNAVRELLVKEVQPDSKETNK